MRSIEKLARSIQYTPAADFFRKFTNRRKKNADDARMHAVVTGWIKRLFENLTQSV